MAAFNGNKYITITQSDWFRNGFSFVKDELIANGYKISDGISRTGEDIEISWG